MPERVQLRRIEGSRKPDGAVVVALHHGFLMLAALVMTGGRRG